MVTSALPSERPGLEDLPHRLVALLGMRARARLRQTARLQPGVELGRAGNVEPRREQTLARVAGLVLDLSLLPTRRRRARHRIAQIMRAHLRRKRRLKRLSLPRKNAR